MKHLKKLREPLPIEYIDFRVQSINKGKYVTILAYKDARVDMKRLDEVVGPENWQRKHLNDNRNCVVSIWNPEIQQWISKEDTGTESFTEKEKGLASDSFKRACFNWGIGIELYDYPLISFKLNDDEVQEFNGKLRPSFKFNLRDWKWNSKIENGELVGLYCQDTTGKVRFKWMKEKK